MKKFIAGFVLLLVLALWIFSGVRAQQSAGQQSATAQAQLTIVARPAPSPTP